MKTLELIFLKDDGKTTTFSLDNPVTPVNEQTVNAAMDTILASSIFTTLGAQARKKEARLVERNVSDIMIQA
ncbi:DUF2922 domain-containing protein [Bacillus manliponensis]|uniref:DUF2922 domain-containing protein n=1 Tax=Bacillus manliponensis TaxID=574376 RepID=UPI0035126845